MVDNERSNNYKHAQVYRYKQTQAIAVFFRLKPLQRKKASFVSKLIPYITDKWKRGVYS